MTFGILGAIGLIWVLCWRRWYRDPPEGGTGAHAAMHRDVPWRELMRERQLWLIFMMIAPVTMRKLPTITRF